MKICKIYIKDFRQFRDFELDLTYPKGHPKEGEPLEKVCFIGSNGTGKSTLLETIETRMHFVAITYRMHFQSIMKFRLNNRKNIY